MIWLVFLWTWIAAPKSSFRALAQRQKSWSPSAFAFYFCFPFWLLLLLSSGFFTVANGVDVFDSSCASLTLLYVHCDRARYMRTFIFRNSKLWWKKKRERERNIWTMSFFSLSLSLPLSLFAFSNRHRFINTVLPTLPLTTVEPLSNLRFLYVAIIVGLVFIRLFFSEKKKTRFKE